MTTCILYIYSSCPCTQDSARVARKFMDAIQSINFNLIALAKTPPQDQD